MTIAGKLSRKIDQRLSIASAQFECVPLTRCCCCCWLCRWNAARWCRCNILWCTDILCALRCRIFRYYLTCCRRKGCDFLFRPLHRCYRFVVRKTIISFQFVIGRRPRHVVYLANGQRSWLLNLKIEGGAFWVWKTFMAAVQFAGRFGSA